eukprot:gnl/TRDRNA2_/TRDRNA2_185427_c0_seq1.p1 gnl/TRDRNA2_/TRDRNA2_185427_c0~~gnl/TRDRNA2_/TRDRNA2_185427_c0_seq1.p1  ORF type:complete len:216 (-),score=40.18 gnl/TRDRNA2_/TRDRNA2_185427_c0_seq1:106-753(-)
MAKSASKGRLSKHGQHMPQGSGCIATSRNGKACKHPRATKFIPYCTSCMRSGDPSLKAVQHPRFGKILIATRTLKAPYYAAWWGNLIPLKKMKKKDKEMEWALRSPKGWIDATPHPGSQLKFTACPGPNEVANIDFAPNDEVLLSKAADQSCLIFRTSRDIPKNYQLTMTYGEDKKSMDAFFAERGLVRSDVGIPKHPAMRKKSAGPAPWKKKKP